jgi:hypothetical protein
VDETALARHRAARGWTTPVFSMRSAADEIKERLRDVNRTFTAPAIVTPIPDLGRCSPGARCVAPDDVLDLQPARMIWWSMPWRFTGRMTRWARSCNAAVR